MDKRKDIRRTLQPGTIVKFKKTSFFGLLKPRTVQSASIIDLSLGGIGVEYQTNSKWSLQFDRISIGTEDKSIDIDLIDCRIISDAAVGRPLEGTYTRRCGIKFMQLSGTVKSKLAQLIESRNIKPQGSQSRHNKFA